MLLLADAPHVRAQGAQITQIRGDAGNLGPDVSGSSRLGAEQVIRHREVGRRFDVLARGARIQFANLQVGDAYGEIKVREQRAPNRRTTVACM
jgi:hypothetical protein